MSSTVWEIAKGDRRIIGVMLESNLVAGAQKLVPGQSLVYGSEVHAHRHSVAALHPAARQGPRAFLAVRRLERAAQSLGGRGDLPCALERDFPKPRANARPARRLCDGRMAAAGGL